jgi:hypothetical protein
MAIDCGDIPEPRCTALAASYGTMAGVPVTELVMACVGALCTALDGQARIGLLTVDGNRTATREAWGSPQVAAEPPPPENRAAPLCQGIPLAKCREMDGTADLPVGAPEVDRTIVTCTSGCTATKGDGRTVVHFVDGTQMTFQWGYEGG